ncbi:hypothetical protein [Absidia glauca]|uniref:RlpA-like protein double-psi beta-barrel domain-containing protein n=1 Tax=Absidia glauca TaxID=4829 RepID=A0A163JXG1_ABSGL|nr:hypothetical protein [Absidia glauca]
MLLQFALIPVMMMVFVHAIPIEERGLKDTLVKATGKYTGKATFFHPDDSGSIGSCGRREGDHSLYVALNLPQYGNENAVSEWCFKKILIKFGDKATEATIGDACPGCKPKSLDLTPEVFEKLAPTNTGVIDISWCVIGEKGCTGGGSGKASAS